MIAFELIATYYSLASFTTFINHTTIFTYVPCSTPTTRIA